MTRLSKMFARRARVVSLVAIATIALGVATARAQSGKVMDINAKLDLIIEALNFLINPETESFRLATGPFRFSFLMSQHVLCSASNIGGQPLTVTVRAMDRDGQPAAADVVLELLPNETEGIAFSKDIFEDLAGRCEFYTTARRIDVRANAQLLNNDDRLVLAVYPAE